MAATRSGGAASPEGATTYDDVIVRYETRTRRVLRYLEPDDHYYPTGVPWVPVRIGADDLEVEYVNGPDEKTTRATLQPISIEDVR